MAKIQLFFGGSLQSEFSLNDCEQVAVGRSPDCDIVIDNLAVSRCHCVFKDVNRQWTVEDNYSANGTFVNGQRITVQPLRHQDRIVVGKHTLLFDDYGSGHTHPPTGEIDDQPDPSETFLLEEEHTRFMRRDVVAGYSQRSQKDKPMVLALKGRRRTVVPLDKKSVLIGSGRHCDLRIGGWFVKSEQARVVKQPYGYKIVHGGGWRSMWINGEKVKEAILQAGDVIIIAGTRISFGSL